MKIQFLKELLVGTLVTVATFGWLYILFFTSPPPKKSNNLIAFSSSSGTNMDCSLLDNEGIVIASVTGSISSLNAKRDIPGNRPIWDCNIYTEQK